MAPTSVFLVFLVLHPCANSLEQQTPGDYGPLDSSGALSVLKQTVEELGDPKQAQVDVGLGAKSAGVDEAVVGAPDASHRPATVPVGDIQALANAWQSNSYAPELPELVTQHENGWAEKAAKTYAAIGNVKERAQNLARKTIVAHLLLSAQAKGISLKDADEAPKDPTEAQKSEGWLTNVLVSPVDKTANKGAKAIGGYYKAQVAHLNALAKGWDPDLRRERHQQIMNEMRADEAYNNLSVVGKLGHHLGKFFGGGNSNDAKETNSPTHTA